MGDGPFNNTKKAGYEVGESFTTGWTNPWDADTPDVAIVESIEGLGDATKNAIATGVAAGDVLVADVGALVTMDAKELTAVTDIAASASLHFLKKKIEDLKTAWNTPVKVTVKTILDEISPYCSGDLAKDQIPKFTEVLKNLIGTLLGADGETWGDMFSDLGEQALDYVTSDEEFLDSVADLNSIKTFADTLNTIGSIINAVTTIMQILEPVRPVLETTYLFVASWFTGGASSVLGTSNMTETIEAVIQRLTSWALKTLRKFVYNIRFSIPSLLVNAFTNSGLSIKDYANASWDKFLAGTDYYAAFSDQYYEDNLATPLWKEQIDKVTEDLEERYKDLIDKVSWATELSSRWSRYNSGMVSGVLDAVIKKARRASDVPDYNEVIWSDPTTWYNKAQNAWTRTGNDYKWWQLLLGGDLENYSELTSNEDNPIRSWQDVISISGYLRGSDMYKSWLDDLAADQENKE